MQLHEALELIAERFGLSADNLKQHVSEDAIGGWHTAPDVARWPMGSLFGVEGQILYALVRELKPLNVINLGVLHGASTAHIAAALKANGNDKARVYAVDKEPISLDRIDPTLHPYIKPVQQDAVEFLQGRWPAKATVLFEDLTHETEQVQAVWEIMLKKANLGSLLISHDAEHYIVGPWVKAGIEGAGVDLDDGVSVLVEPSDCGLFLYQQPSDN